MERNKEDKDLECTLSKINVFGLWGRVDRELRLESDVNFIVGPNGTGKTSIIRLVSGVMRGDYSVIREIWFSTLVIRLKSKKYNKTFIIRVKRESDSDFGFFKDAIVEYFEGSLRGVPKIIDNVDNNRLRSINSPDLPAGATPPMAQALSSLCQITWLSLIRAQQLRSAEGNLKTPDNPVDLHITDLQNRFRAYMNGLKSEIENARKDFDRDVFISLLKPRPAVDSVIAAKKLSINQQKKTTDALFDALNFHNDHTRESIDGFYDYISDAVLKVRDKDRISKEPINPDDISKLIALSQLEDITEQWFKHTEQIKKVRSPEIKLRDFNEIIHSG